MTRIDRPRALSQIQEGDRLLLQEGKWVDGDAETNAGMLVVPRRKKWPHAGGVLIP